LSYLANRQTDRQTNKQSLAKNITSLAKVFNTKSMLKLTSSCELMKANHGTSKPYNVKT